MYKSSGIQAMQTGDKGNKQASSPSPWRQTSGVKNPLEARIKSQT